MDSYMEKIRVYLKLRKTSFSFFGRSQYNDWKILVICTIVGLSGALFFGLYIFTTIGEAAAYEAQPLVVHKKINKEVLTQMLQRIEERQKRTEDLKNTKPITADPSL